MSDNIDYDDKVCCIIIGDSSVGKTSIISKYFEGKDTIDHLATAGIGFYYKNIGKFVFRISWPKNEKEDSGDTTAGQFQSTIEISIKTIIFFSRE